MKKADHDSEIISDWKFAAMVVDRYNPFPLHKPIKKEKKPNLKKELQKRIDYQKKKFY